MMGNALSLIVLPLIFVLASPLLFSFPGRLVTASGDRVMQSWIAYTSFTSYFMDLTNHGADYPPVACQLPPSGVPVMTPFIIIITSPSTPLPHILTDVSVHRSPPITKMARFS
jgi:hypothetical protein